MKRKHLELNILFFSFLLLTGGLTGCKQDTEVFVPYVGFNPHEIGDIGRFFDKATIDFEAFVTFPNNDLHDWVNTPNGTQITCPQGIFVTMNDEIVTGQIQLEITEIYSKADMIKHNRMPISSNREVLESGGELLIRAFKDGEELKLAQGQNLKIEINDPEANPEMELFFGTTIDIGGEFPEFAWEEADGNPDTSDNVAVGDWFNNSNEQEVYGYIFETSQLGWINVDRFLKDPSLDLTEVCVDLPEEFDSRNATAYIVFEDLNSIMPLWPNPNVEMFCQNNIPIDMNVKLVVIGERGEGFYFYAEEPFKTSDGMTVQMTPESLGFESVISAIENL